MPALDGESCYVASADLVLIGVTVSPGEDGLRWTPAYDCGANKWLSIRIDGPNPAGKDGRNVSLGLVYDAKRDLIWAVDTNSNIYVLRLDMKAAPGRRCSVAFITGDPSGRRQWNGDICWHVGWHGC